MRTDLGLTHSLARRTGIGRERQSLHSAEGRGLWVCIAVHIGGLLWLVCSAGQSSNRPLVWANGKFYRNLRQNWGFGFQRANVVTIRSLERNAVLAPLALPHPNTVLRFFRLTH